MRTAIKHLKKDPVLAKIIDEAGPFRMQYGEPRFENLVRSIVSQQLSGAVARGIFGRLREAVLAASGEPGLTPQGIIKLRPERMRRCGLSAAKTRYIRDLAKHTKR